MCVCVCVCVWVWVSSQLYEEVRKSLEQCDVQEDIEHFINLRRTGDKPPGEKLRNVHWQLTSAWMQSTPMEDDSYQKKHKHALIHLCLSVFLPISCCCVWELLQWPEVSSWASTLSTASTSNQVNKIATLLIHLSFHIIFHSVLCFILRTQTILMWYCRRGPLPDPTNHSRGMFYLLTVRGVSLALWGRGLWFEQHVVGHGRMQVSLELLQELSFPVYSDGPFWTKDDTKQTWELP